MKKIISAVTIFFLQINVWAASPFVNPVNGAMSLNWTDVEMKAGKTKIPLQRTYNSRDQKVHLFGRGWCTNLEWEIKDVSKTEKTLIACGTGQPEKFKGDGNIWTSTHDGDRVLKFTEGGYLLADKGRSNTKFEMNGRLKEINVAGDGYVKVQWRADAVIITSYDGDKWTLTKNKNGLVEQLQTDSGKKLIYRYQRRALVETETGGKKTRFSYEPKYGQLAALIHPDGRIEKFTYDWPKGSLKEYTNGAGCKQSFKRQPASAGYTGVSHCAY